MTKKLLFFVRMKIRSKSGRKEHMVEHWKYLSKEFDIEDAVGQPSGKVSEAGIVDLNQSGSTNLSVKEAPASTQRKDEQAYTDNAVRLIEAKTRLFITCFVLGALILLIVCGFVAFLLRGDSNILSVILGLIETSVGCIMGYFFAKWEKRKDHE